MIAVDAIEGNGPSADGVLLATGSVVESAGMPPHIGTGEVAAHIDPARIRAIFTANMKGMPGE